MTPTRAPVGMGFGGGFGGYGAGGGGGGSGTSTPGLVVPGQQPQQQQPPAETRAALGAAYFARWAAGPSGVDFEDDVRTVLKKRAKLSGGLGLGGLNLGSGSSSGGPMFPLAIPSGVSSYGRSGLGSSVLVEEDEEEEEESVGGGMNGSGMMDDDGRERTITGSTAATSMSLHLHIPGQGGNNLSLSNPSLSLSGAPPGGNGNGTASASVHALPTDEADALLGLAKVAEGDMDAFAAYAALVPEWCRLEGMLVRGVV